MYVYIHKSYVCVHVQSNSSHTAHVPTNKTSTYRYKFVHGSLEKFMSVTNTIQ